MLSSILLKFLDNIVKVNFSLHTLGAPSDIQNKNESDYQCSCSLVCQQHVKDISLYQITFCASFGNWVSWKRLLPTIGGINTKLLYSRKSPLFIKSPSKFFSFCLRALAYANLDLKRLRVIRILAYVLVPCIVNKENELGRERCF